VYKKILVHEKKAGDNHNQSHRSRALGESSITSGRTRVRDEGLPVLFAVVQRHRLLERVIRRHPQDMDGTHKRDRLVFLCLLPGLAACLIGRARVVQQIAQLQARESIKQERQGVLLAAHSPWPPPTFLSPPLVLPSSRFAAIDAFACTDVSRS